MFSFLRPVCPVEAETAEWIHQRMNFLAAEFGAETAWNATTVLPTDAFFPDRYDGTEFALRQMLSRVCGHMGVERDRVALRLYRENEPVRAGLVGVESHGGTAGLYGVDGKEIIAIEVSRLDNPVAVVATMAHELAHARLLGERRITGDEEDHELLTDLTTIFFGLGIFTANSRCQYTQWTREGWYGWGVNRLGYLSERASCHALGMWALARGEYSPAWLRHLTPGPRSITKKSLRWLARRPAGIPCRPRP